MPRVTTSCLGRGALEPDAPQGTQVTSRFSLEPGVLSWIVTKMYPVAKRLVFQRAKGSRSRKGPRGAPHCDEGPDPQDSVTCRARARPLCGAGDTCPEGNLALGHPAPGGPGSGRPRPQETPAIPDLGPDSRFAQLEAPRPSPAVSQMEML